MTTDIAPDQLYDFDVVDSAGDKIGSVDGVWVDEATNQLEFIGVKTGWLLGKTHIIPANQLDLADNQIRVPYAKDQVQEAPSFATDQELSPADEEQIYGFYGIQRSTVVSPTGLPAGKEAAMESVANGPDTGPTADQAGPRRLPRQETITPAGIDNNLELEEVRRSAEQSSPTPVSAAGIDRVTPEQEARAAQTASLDNPNDTTYAGPEPTPPAEEE